MRVNNSSNVSFRCLYPSSGPCRAELRPSGAGRGPWLWEAAGWGCCPPGELLHFGPAFLNQGPADENTNTGFFFSFFAARCWTHFFSAHSDSQSSSPLIPALHFYAPMFEFGDKRRSMFLTQRWILHPTHKTTQLLHLFLKLSSVESRLSQFRERTTQLAAVENSCALIGLHIHPSLKGKLHPKLKAPIHTPNHWTFLHHCFSLSVFMTLNSGTQKINLFHY